MVVWAGGSGLALTVKTHGFRTVRNSSPDSPDGNLGGSGLALTIKTDGSNSSPDSQGVIWGVKAHFDNEHRWRSHS